MIFVGLHPDQVVGEHRLDQFAMMRHGGEHAARREWCVQEEPNRLADAELAHVRGEREVVIIVDPEGRIRFGEADQRPRHQSIDFAIAGIILARRADQIRARMQCRPECGIGESIVKSAILLFRQSDGGDAAGAITS
jgi:hypothetical protein